ncbi:hypothetical protein X948_5624 [Burkholderia pseudomallei MSHR5608]|nr:hypothetical protein X948_5624 [Burkholderia pseudomallei MSHR5608]
MWRRADARASSDASGRWHLNARAGRRRCGVDRRENGGEANETALSARGMAAKACDAMGQRGAAALERRGGARLFQDNQDKPMRCDSGTRAIQLIRNGENATRRT